jgi:DNA-binding transcriptional regulator YhcF (GntR family)/predicted kinase
VLPDRSRLNRSDALHQQVARNIRNQIEAGKLRDGQVLPSTRDMAAEWGVSVFTITEAMKLLAAEGLVESRSRSKRVVRHSGEPGRAELQLVKPAVVLIGGYAGSGKTELGRILARETAWPMLDKDTITRPVVEAALETIGLSPHDRESSQYLDMIRPREYEALAAALTENVACGNSVIGTAPFIREFRDSAWIERTQATYADLNAEVRFVWVYCDADTMNTYIRHRGAARDAYKIRNWTSYMTSIDVDFRPSARHFVIDNRQSARPLQLQAREFLRELSEQGRQ